MFVKDRYLLKNTLTLFDGSWGERWPAWWERVVENEIDAAPSTIAYFGTTLLGYSARVPAAQNAALGSI